MRSRAGPSSSHRPVVHAASRASGTSDTDISTRSSGPENQWRPAASGWTSRGLARPPERVRLHERASDPRQSPPSRRQAASVRRHGETGDSRDSLLHAGGSCLDAAADDERRTPAARGDAHRSRSTLRPCRRAGARERSAVVHRLVRRAALARRAAPSLSARRHDRRPRLRSRSPSTGGVSRRAGSRSTGGRALRPGDGAEPARWGACCVTQRSAATACTGFASFLATGTRPASVTGATTFECAPGTRPATSRTPAWSSRSQTGASGSRSGTRPTPHRARELQPPIALGGVAPRACHPLDTSSRIELEQVSVEPSGLVLLAGDDLVRVAPPDLQRNTGAAISPNQC